MAAKLLKISSFHALRKSYFVTLLYITLHITVIYHLISIAYDTTEKIYT